MVANVSTQTVTGTEDDDILFARHGDTTISGAGGDDEIRAGRGNDLMYGGLGDDTFYSAYGGYDRLLGGDGHDRFFLTKAGDGETTEAVGGAGNDYFEIGGSRWATNRVVQQSINYIAGGDGNDTFNVYAGAIVTGGAGIDTYLIVNVLGAGTRVKALYIKDFEAGPNGDIINLDRVFEANAHYYGAPSNPFTSDNVRLIQQGADVFIQFEYRGVYYNSVILKNVNVGDLTAENFAGFSDSGAPPTVLTGNDGPDVINTSNGRVTLDGGMGDDTLYDGFYNDILVGREGDDSFDVRQGGADQLYGGVGNDDFLIFGKLANARIDAFGGEGDDYFRINVTNNANAFAFGEAGNDTFEIISGGRVNGGEGRDSFLINGFLGNFWKGQKTLVIEDFETGNGGDILSFELLLSDLRVSGNTQSPHPFVNLYFFQKGDHVVVHLGETQSSSLTEAVYLLNTNLEDFTQENFGGYNFNGASIGLTLTGDDNDNRFFPLGRDNTLYGLGGDDLLSDGSGNDFLFGGDGDDELISIYGGSDRLYGGAGNDSLTARAWDYPAQKIFAFGEDGNDRFVLEGGYVSPIEAHGGNGNDYFRIDRGSNENLMYVFGDAGDDTFDLDGWGRFSGGEGRDTYIVRRNLAQYAESTRPVIIDDFETGAAGDIVSLAFFPMNIFGTVDAGGLRYTSRLPDDADPFASDHLRLFQYGKDVIITVHIGGADDIRYLANSGLLTFTGLSVHDFTSENFGGLDISNSKFDALTLQGDANDNELTARIGNHIIEGLGGNDTLSDGKGDDILYGGDGNDALTVNGGYYDQMFGGDGFNQFFIAVNGPSNLVEATGGKDADYFDIRAKYGAKAFAVGLGGNDTFDIHSGTTVNGGAGRDIFILNNDIMSPGPSGPVIIKGFEAGATGDIINLNKALVTPHNQSTDPFGDGYFELVQIGAHVVLMVDPDGDAGPEAATQWAWILNTTLGDLTPENFNGLDPFPMASEAPLEEPADFAEEPAMMEHVHINALHEDLFV